MAFDAKPSSWIASWSEDAADVTFPLASLTQTLTADEADATTGDWRDCFFSIVDHTYDYYNGLATADKPTKLTISKTGALQSDGSMRYTYSIVVTAAISGEDVVAES